MKRPLKRVRTRCVACVAAVQHTIAAQDVHGTFTGDVCFIAFNNAVYNVLVLYGKTLYLAYSRLGVCLSIDAWSCWQKSAMSPRHAQFLLFLSIA